MTDHNNNNAEPQLAPPVALLRSGAAMLSIPALVVIGLVSFGAYSYAPPSSQSDRASKPAIQPPPSSASQLSGNVVTIVPPDDHEGFASVLAALQLPEAQRSEIKRQVRAGERRIGWVVFTDSIDPDGDVIAVQAAGFTQHVVLSKAWTPVAVPLADGAPIAVTAVKDGVFGGITLALATRGGTLALRILKPGERIEVMP